MNAPSLNTSDRATLRRRHWLAWIALCGALAIHVADEALTDFLAIYNPTVVGLRDEYPWLRLPTFTFENWLALLIFAVVALIAVSYFVWRGRWAMRPISHVFAGFMLLNGLLHIAGSIYLGKLMPGVYSSPLLLAASVFLIVSTRAYSRSREPSIASRV
jgi:hypothetical protein